LATTTSIAVQRARKRADARSAQFRSAGFWGRLPVDLLRAAAANDPDRIAVATRAESLTYAELDALTVRAAATLNAHRMSLDCPVVLVTDNSLASLVAIHAELRSGGILHLVSANAGAAHVRDVIIQTGAGQILAPGAWAAQHPDALIDGVVLVTTEELCSSEDGGYCSVQATVRVGRDPDDPAIVIFTSGTTSRPKGVIHSLNTLLTASRNYIDAAKLDANDGLFLVSPMASVTGVLQAITVPPLLGARVILEDKWSAQSTFEWLLASSGTFFGGPDLLLDQLLDEADRREKAVIPLKAVFLGGSKLDSRILRRVEQERGIIVMPAYGSSEAPISTSGRREEPAAVRLADDGVPLPGVEIILGSKDDPNECCIGGPHLFLGYVDPDDDAVAFRDLEDREVYCSGDIGRMEKGRLQIIGRLKDIVIRNGLKIPIAEVEGLVEGVPGVRRAAGLGVSDSQTGERLVMVVQLHKEASVSYEQLTDSLIAAGLAKWKLPEELITWDGEFPLTGTGKVQRNILAENLSNRPTQRAPRLG
jgi:acyl-CoA synthetase (AMP-forming)/AMP-acid ligase II